MASSTASSSAGTLWISRGRLIAVSGSLRPLPVTMQTTVLPARSNPSDDSLRSPASAAAEFAQQCANDLDDDGDTVVNDGCFSVGRGNCEDGVDNDGDTFTDGADAGCNTPEHYALEIPLPLANRGAGPDDDGDSVRSAQPFGLAVGPYALVLPRVVHGMDGRTDLFIGAYVQHRLELAGKRSLRRIFAHRGRANGERWRIPIRWIGSIRWT